MWFKLAFIVAFVIAVAIATTTARRATRHHGGLLSQLAHEIRALLIVRAVLGLVFYGALSAWMFWPGALAWMYFPLTESLRWIAVALLIPALALFAWSFRSLGTNYRGGVGLYDGHELVNSGPYRWIRHPIYVAFICIMVLVLPLSANWVLGASGILLVVSIAVGRIPREERELSERFGDAWETYRRRTPQLFPRI